MRWERLQCQSDYYYICCSQKPSCALIDVTFDLHFSVSLASRQTKKCDARKSKAPFLVRARFLGNNSCVCGRPRGRWESIFAPPRTRWLFTFVRCAHVIDQTLDESFWRIALYFFRLFVNGKLLANCGKGALEKKFLNARQTYTNVKKIYALR